ncbi:unnamed protein product [Effrenium voratum]|nr:unnamed protein product [Effrenium voratum]
MALALLALAAVPAAAYEFVGGATSGAEVASGGKMTMGGKVGGYASLLQASNPSLGELSLVLECCGGATSLASEAANDVNVNTFGSGAKKGLLEKYTEKNTCTKASEDAVANDQCNYAYSFHNKDWMEAAYSAFCVPSDVCSVDVVGMTKGTKIGYSVVEQILNNNAGDLMFAGYGKIGSCLGGMNDVNLGATSKFVKEVPKFVELVPGVKIPTGKKTQGFVFEGMKEQGVVEMLGTCEPTSENGMLYVYKNKFWNEAKGLVDIDSYLKIKDDEAKQALIKEQTEKAKDKAEESAKSAAKSAVKPAAAKPAAADAATEPATEPAEAKVTLDPMEKLEEISEAASKAKDAAKDAEEAQADPAAAAAEVLGTALDKAEDSKAADVKEAAEKVAAALPATTEEAAAAAKAAADKLAADTQAAADKLAAQTKAAQEAAAAAAKEVADKLAAQTKAAQEAAEESADAVKQATEEQAAAVKKAAETHAAAIQKAAEDSSAALQDATQDVGEQATAVLQAATDAAKDATEQATAAESVDARRLSAMLI